MIKPESTTLERIATALERIAGHCAAADVLAERRRKNREHMAAVRNSRSVCTQTPNERRQETEEEKSPHTPLKGEGKEKKKEYPHRVRAREANFDDLFDRFWADYPGPRKTDKKKCRQKFAAILAASDDQEAMFKRLLDGLSRWRLSRDWTDDGGAYVCAPLVWLNNERWTAEIEPCPVRRPAPQSAYEREQAEIAANHRRVMDAFRRIQNGDLQ